jgi:hypothetical protein
VAANLAEVVQLISINRFNSAFIIPKNLTNFKENAINQPRVEYNEKMYALLVRSVPHLS